MRTVSVFLTEAFPSFHFEGDDFVTLNMAEDLGLDLGFNVCTNSDAAISISQEDFSELYFVSGIAVDTGDIQCLVFLDLELLAGYLYYC